MNGYKYRFDATLQINVSLSIVDRINVTLFYYTSENKIILIIMITKTFYMNGIKCEKLLKLQNF